MIFLLPIREKVISNFKPMKKEQIVIVSLLLLVTFIGVVFSITQSMNSTQSEEQNTAPIEIRNEESPAPTSTTVMQETTPLNTIEEESTVEVPPGESGGVVLSPTAEENAFMVCLGDVEYQRTRDAECGSDTDCLTKKNLERKTYCEIQAYGEPLE